MLCRRLISLSRSLQRTGHATFSDFKSSASLDTLYPGSSLNILKLYQYQPVSNGSSFTGYIPIDDLRISYTASSGPGGQNVNKVHTKVDVRFHLDSASWIPDDIKKRIHEQFPNRITSDGYFVMKSDLTRSQQLNLADALEKIRTVIRTAAFVPATASEETLEKIRRRKEKAAIERLKEKKLRSAVKQDRSAPILD